MSKERWWTAPAEAESGRTVIVTARDYVDKMKDSGKFPYLIRVSWRYSGKPDGFPEDGDAETMGIVTDALMETFRKDKAAYLVAVTTGDGVREWIFYTGNLNIFGKVFNRALEEIDTIPIEIEALEDPDWDAYCEIRENSYIPENEDER